jgi:multidrug efflux pump subunit AcrA (membrane-fusion protein)
VKKVEVKNTKGKITIILISIIAITMVLIMFQVVKGCVQKAPATQTTQTAQGDGNRGGGSASKAGERGGNSASNNQSASRGGGSGERGGGSNERGGGGGSASRAGERGGGGGERAGTAIRVTPVVLDTIENSVILNGDVLSSSQVSIYPVMAGKVTQMRVRAGDRVSAGQVVAMVDPSRPGDSFFPNPVVSTVSGVVVNVPVNIGDTLQTNSVICVVGNLSDLRVETYVPERYSVNIRRLLPAQISFEAMPGETFAAEVDELSPVLDPASRTLRIRLRIVPGSNGRIDPRIIAGMFATVSLVTNSRQDVPVILRTSLIQTYGSWIVFVIPPDSPVARRKEVTLGLESETMVEILSGLTEGELVVSEGQNFLTDGDPVRILE